MKVFIAHSVRDRDLVENLTPLLRQDGHEVILPGEMEPSGNIFAEISASIRSAAVLIAAVTAVNPHIYYEIGLAAGAGIPTLITARSSEVLPANLTTVPYVQLTDDILRDALVIARRVNDLESLAKTSAVEFDSPEATLQAAAENTTFLESLGPTEFERLVVNLFKDRGWFEVGAIESTKDAAVDFTLTSSKHQEVILVEVKKLSKQSRVSVGVVRRFLSAVSGLEVSLGMLVAPSGFTAAALALAVGTPLVLRTLKQILAAKSKKELLELAEPDS